MNRSLTTHNSELLTLNFAPVAAAFLLDSGRASINWSEK
jgi:hypothetical protein